MKNHSSACVNFLRQLEKKSISAIKFNYLELSRYNFHFTIYIFQHLILLFYLQNKAMMDWCIQQLEYIVIHHKISYRVRFLCENVIELRKKKWDTFSVSPDQTEPKKSENKVLVVGRRSFIDESSLSNLESAKHFGGKHHKLLYCTCALLTIFLTFSV